jgi:hypothetical protein
MVCVTKLLEGFKTLEFSRGIPDMKDPEDEGFELPFTEELEIRVG